MTSTDGAIRDVVISLRQLVLASIRFRQALAAELNLSENEIAALGYLRQAGELTPRELAALLQLTSGSMTGLVDRLEGAGYAARRPHPGDRRSVLVSATEAGQGAVEQVFRRFDEVLGEGLEHAQVDLDVLSGALRATAHTVRRYTDGGQDPITAVRNRA
jgi:DNA-binding MarR family transcriptional regulator